MKEVKIGLDTINKYKPDGFALQQVFQGAQVNREYNVGGSWSKKKPTAKPDGVRVVFDSIDRFRAARDTYFAWKSLMSMHETKLKPELPDKVAQRLFRARETQEPLNLFVPWGVRPQGEFGSNEETVMHRLQRFQENMQRYNIDTSVLLMPADLYATEVNQQVASDQVSNYFSRVEEAGNAYGFTVKPWSEIRAENRQMYDRLATAYSDAEIRKVLTPHKVEEAFAAAGRRSGQTDKERIQKAGFAYLRERLCEAEIVEAIYQPVKVSAVAKNKDNEVDLALPRVYIIPEALQFSWLKL